MAIAIKKWSFIRLWVSTWKPLRIQQVVTWVRKDRLLSYKMNDVHIFRTKPSGHRVLFTSPVVLLCFFQKLQSGNRAVVDIKQTYSMDSGITGARCSVLCAYSFMLHGVSKKKCGWIYPNCILGRRSISSIWIVKT